MKRRSVTLATVALLLCALVESQEAPNSLPDWARSPTFLLSPGTLRPIDGKGPVCSFLGRGAQELDFDIPGWGTAPEVPEDSSLSKRFVFVSGVLRHEQNPNPKTYAADPELKLPGYDKVLLIVDYERCRVVRILSIEPPEVQKWQGCSMFAYDDSAAFITNGERTFIYSGEAFEHRAAVLDYQIDCDSEWLGLPHRQYWFPSGYYTLNGPEACFLVMKREGDLHRLLKAIECKDLVGEARTAPAKNGRGAGTILLAGEEIRLCEPVYADDKLLVLHYETQAAGTWQRWLASRTPGTVGPPPAGPEAIEQGVGRRFLSAVSLATLQLKQTPLPTGVQAVRVERAAAGLQCWVSEARGAGESAVKKSVAVELPL